MADAAVAEAATLEEEAAQECDGAVQDAREQAERKCRQAYALQLQSYHQKMTIAARQTIQAADEICVLREEARRQAIDQDTQCPWLVIPMSRKGSLKEKGWLERVAGKALVVLLDVSFCDQWGAEDLLPPPSPPPP